MSDAEEDRQPGQKVPGDQPGQGSESQATVAGAAEAPPGARLAPDEAQPQQQSTQAAAAEAVEVPDAEQGGPSGGEIPATAGRGLSLPWLGLPILVTLLLVAGALWLGWRQLYLPQQQLRELLTGEQRLDEALREQQQQTLVALQQLQSQVQEDRERIASLQRDLLSRQAQQEDTLARAAEQAAAALAAVSQDQAGWRMANAEALLELAGERLELAGDLPVAVAAMSRAQQALAGLAVPGLTDVRAVLAEEIATLRAVPAIDRAGLALRIGALVKQVDHLPLARPMTASSAASGEQRPAAAAGDGVTGWRQRASAWLARLEQVFEEALSVQRVDRAPTPLLPPSKRYFLTRNLALSLQSARMALLNGDYGNCRDLLGEARQLLLQNFDRDAPPVRAMVNSLAELRRQPWPLEVPRVGRALQKLRQLRADRALP